MKKTQWTELFYNIKHTLVSFVAIILFAALSAALFTGIRWTGYALSASMEKEYSEGRFHHFELSSPLGFEEEFSDSLLQRGLADEAEGYYETYRHLLHDGKRAQVRLVSLKERIDLPYCVEGTLPARKGEAAVDAYWANENDIRVGDVLSFRQLGSASGALPHAVLKEDLDALLASSEPQDELVTESFSVTALIGSAEYMGTFSDTNGPSPFSPAPVDSVIFLHETSFDPEAFCGYPKLAVRIHALDAYQTGSEEYADCAEEWQTALENAANDYARERSEALRSAAGNMKAALAALPMPLSDVEEALDVLSETEVYTVFLAPRETNFSYIGVDALIQTFRKMQYSMVSLFAVIAILVCYSAVSRLVYDQTVLIGTKKALGFSGKDILRPFMIYAFLAVLTGSVLGAGIGRFLIEPIMVSSVQMNYRFRWAVYAFRFREIAIFSLLQGSMILLTAYFTCKAVSKRPPLTLLKGEEQSGGSIPGFLEKLPFWNRLPLLKKTAIRNCLQERSRVFATIIGVMGCTALVVCAVSSYDNLSESFTLTTEKVTLHDSVLYFSGDEQTKEELGTLLKEEEIPHALFRYQPGTMESPEGERLLSGVYTTDDEQFYRLFHLYDSNDGKERQPKGGAWVNLAYREYFGAQEGDTLLFTDASGEEHELPIEGFYEYYLTNYHILLPKSLYEEEFGTLYAANAVLVQSRGTSFEALRPSVLAAEDGLLIWDQYEESKELIGSILTIGGATTGVYLGLSFVLAVLLLLNLFTMLVSEKKKELITLMINGFSAKQAEAYIRFDTSFLTLVGIVLGTALGIVMGKKSLESFNTITTFYLNRMDGRACLFAALYTSLLTFLMCRSALRKVRRFRLSDINAM